MRVIHLLNTGSYSGAENVAITIIKSMRKYNDVENFYVSLDGPIRQILENEKINFIAVNKVNVKNIKRVIKKYKPDIIHAHDYTTSIIAFLCFSHLKIISHLHNNSPWLKKRGIFSYAYFLASHSFSKIFTVSKSIEYEYVFSKYIAHKIQCIDNPIDINIVQQKAMEYEIDEQYDLIYLGRLTKQKNPDLLLDIIDQLVKKKANIQIAVVGSGELFKDFQQEIIRKKFQRNVKLYGFIENPYPILKKSKVLCLPSKWEGYGLVAIEALALGVPVVCSGAGGLSNIVDECCGAICLFDVKKYLQEILSLLSNDEYYKNKQFAAIEKAKKINNISSYIENIYLNYKNIIEGDI
ncbi:glycosyltransferase [Thomasclavelia saccharogumia]|uniref:glycosyltransferase n=1 Tax=Thomasclavelia saccharogumia TaxID=341225 RepID=UPI00047CCCF4|nr:glycosyltransferase [Thomasclavelia saccharogumia]